MSMIMAPSPALLVLVARALLLRVELSTSWVVLIATSPKEAETWDWRSPVTLEKE